jgi:ABC-type uncharacterized transport system auxiliary subunit
MRGRRSHAALAAALLLAGCTALQAVPQVRTFRITYRPPEALAALALPVTVRVLPFGIASAYDSQSFLYRTGPYDVGIDYYNRWVGDPAHMIADLVARDLAAANVVTAVVQTPSALPTDYELSGHIETLEERDEGSSGTAHLRLRTVLVRVPPQGPRYVVLQEGDAADAPCTPADPASYAAAMSSAVQQVSDHIRAGLVQAITADLARPQ